jgi:hypothetical protein
MKDAGHDILHNNRRENLKIYRVKRVSELRKTSAVSQAGRHTNHMRKEAIDWNIREMGGGWVVGL